MKSLGLALGGGGLKGMAHIGVLQVLQENGLKAQYMAGTSAGSIIAALYASGISPYQMEAIVLKIKPTDYIDYNVSGFFKYLLGQVLPFYNAPPLEGFILGNKLENMMFELTGGRRLAEAEVPLAVVACDIDSGQKVVFVNQDLQMERNDVMVVKDALISTAVRCSVSIPVTFVPKDFAGIQMVDGGLKEIVPASMAKKMGADFVLSVNLGQEMYDTRVEGIPQIISRTLSILTFETSEAEEEIYSDMILFPGVQGVPLDDTEAIAKMIRAGRRVMKDHMAELKRQLGYGDDHQTAAANVSKRT